jgi:hypothetical protein
MKDTIGLWCFSGSLWFVFLKSISLSERNSHIIITPKQNNYIHQRRTQLWQTDQTEY